MGRIESSTGETATQQQPPQNLMEADVAGRVTYGRYGMEVGEWGWELHQMTFGKWRLMLTNGQDVSEFYCMENFELGVNAYRDVVASNKKPETGWLRAWVNGKFIYPDN